ncbi:MAG: STAS domain-containing protein [Bacteroidetes bacterium]|nr:STAS domain-containing protein [Bacteroidota bacterium]MBU1578977.1 STAS domain-containing protein [Bacteroidota bacterium]MBU2466980.1 STAS domain-containing protein [Bacteroidota bacterium]MBU2558692.1 STAS domain-containing protein [Bacteroidota bacterium]
MKLNFSEVNNFKVIEIIGRIDSITAPDFENGVMKFMSDGVTKLIFDCSKLDYVSSSGLRVFLMAQKKLSTNKGMLKVCCLQPAIKEIFDISGFSQIFAIEDTIESASRN